MSAPSGQMLPEEVDRAAPGELGGLAVVHRRALLVHKAVVGGVTDAEGRLILADACEPRKRRLRLYPSTGLAGLQEEGAPPSDDRE